MEPTSASSQGSEGSTSPSKPSATDASDRSSGTDIASGSSNDGGRMFPEPVTLLPTPNARDGSRPTATPAWYEERNARLKAANPKLGELHKPLETVVMERQTSSAEGSPANPPPPPADAREPRTIAGSGPSSPVLLATFDPGTSFARTFQASLLSTEDERFPRSWETWPRSGMTRRGEAFALPMSAHPIDGNGSSYLPTPNTQDGYTVRNPHTVMLTHRVDELLHTPTTGDTNPNYDHRASPGYVRKNGVPNLAAQVDELLPTPKTPTGGSEARAGRKDRGSGGEDLEARLRSLGDPTPPRSDDGSEP